MAGADPEDEEDAVPFEVFTRRSAPRTELPRATLQKQGILAVNEAAYALLGAPRAVELLYDRAAGVIGLRAVHPSLPHAYAIRRRGKSRSYHVAVAGFARHYGIPMDATRTYPAEKRGDVLAVRLDP